jgi:membrane-bound lytic murein transglycosylase A
MYELVIANKNYSSWSMRPWVLMRSLGIEFTERLLPFHPNHGAGAIARYSPSGRVPCLVDGETRVWDSLAIVEYLAERHVGVWPMPAAVRAWARSAAAMHSGSGAAQRCSMNVGIRVRLRSVSPALQSDLRRLETLWVDGLDRHGGPFLGGARFTAVDAFFAPVATRIQTYGLAVSGAAAAYASHLLQHDAVREWIDAGLRETWRDPPQSRTGRQMAAAAGPARVRIRLAAPLPALWSTLLALSLGALMTACVGTRAPPPTTAAQPVPHFKPVEWSRLPGWGEDAITEAWPALLASCGAPRMRSEWRDVCAAGQPIGREDVNAQRRLLESSLRAWRVTTRIPGRRGKAADSGLVTGYYEPLLNGARARGGPYQWPLYAVPDDLLTIELGDLYPALKGERVRGRLQGRRVVPYADRAQLADGKALAGKELVWVDSAIDAFFLQIQGSGRVQLTDGTTVRLAYADVNGQPYKAIGRQLVENGDLTLEQATAPGIRQWLLDHPERQAEVLNSNPSVVFFREEEITDPELGPRGALGVPLTAGRSVAIDARLLPLGAPLFLATTHPVSGEPLRRLVVGQDTGGAIRGAIRADLFFGLGSDAGEQAGRMRSDGKLWLLWPKGLAPPVDGN